MAQPQQVEMRGISITFGGFPALKQVNFTLKGGSVHALTGANGAGKSTLMAILSGTHEQYEGALYINDEPVTIRSPREAKLQGIHLVQQEVDVALVPGLSVGKTSCWTTWPAPVIALTGQHSGSRRARRWHNWMCIWMSKNGLKPAPWRKNSKSCWPGRCLTIAAS